MTLFHRDEFVGKFVQEARDNLEVLNRGLVHLEKSPDDGELLTELMRSAHTLKGSSRMLTYMDVNQVAHRTEDVLEAIRDGHLVMSAEVGDVLFMALDEIGACIEAIAGGGEGDRDVSGLCSALEELPATDVAVSEPVSEPAAGGDVAALDTSQFVGSFVQEARENLAVLNQGMVALEKTPDAADLLTELMRAAHTLKGTSRMLQLMDINQVAHRSEDVLEAIRDGRVVMSAEVGDVLFLALDEIDACLEAIAGGGQGDRDVSALCGSLEELTAAEAAPVGDEAVEEEAAPEPATATAAGPAAEPRVAIEVSEPTAPGTAPAVAAAPVAAAPAQDAPPSKKAAEQVEETLRIGTMSLDTVIRLAGEIRISGMRLDHTFGQFADTRRAFRRFQGDVERCPGLRGAHDGPQPACHEIGAIYARLDDLYRGYREDLAGLERMVAELQEKALDMRMLPLSTLFDVLPRAVRDLARDVGKEIELVVEGAHTRMDKKIIEQLDGPLVHMVRNCIDHGIETPEERQAAGKPRAGTLRIAASQEGDHIAIVVEDDGHGVNLEAVRDKARQKELVDAEQLDRMEDREIAYLIFLPGFSTAAIITDLSGRGVGMDVVRSAIEGLKGVVSVATESGHGTRFTLQLPMTLTTTRAMMVESGGLSFSVPISYVSEVVEVEPEAITQVVDREAICLRDQMIPIADLGQVLGLRAAAPTNGKSPTVLILHSGPDVTALTVDEIVDEEDILLKPLPAHLGETPCVSGVSIFGDSQISVVLHVPGLVEAMRSTRAPRASTVTPSESAAGRRILVVDDSLNTREIEKSILEAHGYEVDVARDGVEGLAMARETAYDMVVTDLDMPRMDGFTLVENLRNEPDHAHTPIVIVTSREQEQDRRRGIDVGADAYISKGGFDQSKLIDTIGSLLG